MKQARTLKSKELKAVLAYVATRRHAVRDRAIVVTSFLSGMRAHELASLRLGDVVGEGGRVRDEIALDASQTKGRHARRVFINAKLKKSLAIMSKTLVRIANHLIHCFARRRSVHSTQIRCASFFSASTNHAASGARVRTVAGARSSRIWQASLCRFVFSQFWLGTAQFRRRSYTLTAMISSCGTLWSWLDCREQWGRVSSAVSKSCPLCLAGSTGQGVCMFDVAQRLIFCNKRYADLYGLTSEQTKPGTLLRTILQHRISNGSAPEDHEAYIRDRLSEVSVNKPYQITNKLRDGRQILVVHRPIADGGWVATHEDVTEIMRREESFRLLFDSNPVPMWVCDRENLGFLAVNEAAVKHYGYSCEQFMAMSVLDLRPAEDRERFVHFLCTLPDNQLAENVTQHTKADGSKIDVCVYSRTMTYEGHNSRLVAVHDITERKRAEDELHRTNVMFEKKNLQFDTALNNMVQGLLMYDRAGKLVISNRCFAELFQLPWEKWATASLGMTVLQTMQLRDDLNKTVTEKNRPEILAAVKDMLERHAPRSVVAERSDGRALCASFAPMADAGFVVTFDDITERRRKDNQIFHMAHYDTLTDLPNRLTFKETLDATLDRAGATGKRFAIMILDLDHFKEANDTYGHMVGDEMLREVGRRLQAVSEEALLTRLGGDEFAVIMVDGEQPAAAATLAERLLATLVDDFEVEGDRVKLSMSIGIAIFPTGGADAKTLMSNADAALYRAKAEFRGTALFFEPEMGDRLHERYALQEDLRFAIDRGELLLHYQPQVTMSGEAVGFEALVRWQCPKRGMVAPGTFIPIAEESSLIISLGEWVLREACREAASWPQPLTIAVNISPIQFRHADLPGLVHSILLETGLSPGRLELEITESVLINDFSRAVSILNRLKSLGVRIAMDDFGTGYSSLSYLRSFVCDKIKIDRVFVCDLEQNHHSRSIVRAVIGLGRSLDLPILAEGVETEAQHAFLVQEGCDEVQGYLTGRPMPIADYATLVGRRAVTQQNYAVAG
jgi:diguanylate cyclase (GGDEF)-like protein/PAS domain S-box-containing protein